jgi:hypothetical protein
MKHSSQYRSFNHSEWSHKHDFPIEEIWNTENTIAAFIAPRLRAFKSLEKHGFPSDLNSEGQWNSAIQKMTDAFEILSHPSTQSNEDDPIIEEGLDLFRKYYRDLWD